LTIKLALGLSNFQLDTLSRLLSTDFSADPEVAGGGTETRRTLGQFDLEMPKLKMQSAVTALQNKLAQAAGVTASSNGKMVSADVPTSITSRLLGKPTQFYKFEQGVSTIPTHVQIMGDGYRHRRRLKIIQIVLRVVGYAEYAGSLDAVDAVAMFDGAEDYDTIKEACRPLLEATAAIDASGGLECTWKGEGEEQNSNWQGNQGQEQTGKVPITWIAGGDMSWIQSVMGMCTWDFCLWCKCPANDFHHGRQGIKRTTEEQYHLCHEFYGEEQEFVCPGCSIKLTRAQDNSKHQGVMASKKDTSTYRKKHNGHEQGKPPVFKNIETMHHIVCVLHFLLRIVATLFKHFVVRFIEDSDQKAKAVTAFLHEECHVCIPEIKTSGKGENVDQAQRVTFNGNEAWRVLMNMDALCAMVCGSQRDLGEMKKCTDATMNYFEILYRDETEFSSRQAKAKELIKQGRVVIAAFIPQAAKESVTPYLHTMVCAIPSQVEMFDVLKASGQALENLNQWRKKFGRSNGKNTPGQRGNTEQLMVQETARRAVDLTSRAKPAPHKRQKQLRDQSGPGGLASLKQAKCQPKQSGPQQLGDAAVDYSGYSLAQLKDACKAKGLPVSGTKAVLRGRIAEAAAS
jgi:hypothetical protein